MSPLLLPLLLHILPFLNILTTSTSSTATLDPKQLRALHSLGLPTTPDPCTNNNTTLFLCDSSTPFRHVTSLSLQNCSPSLLLPLSGHPLPLSLSSSLLSLSISLSMHSDSSTTIRLSGVWLSRLRRLRHLSLLSLPVSASSPSVFLSHMPALLSASAPFCRLRGPLPHRWHSPNLTLLDLSSNALSDALPGSIANLTHLKNLSLSRNLLSGPIPTRMAELAELAHLDLGGNRFNGSVPEFLGEMGRLRFLSLEDNEFVGALPFNESFIRMLEVFRVGGNAGLCYNRSLVSEKLGLGIAPCDEYGLPVSPPPNLSDGGSDDDDHDDHDDDDDGDDDGGSSRKSERRSNEGGHHHGPNKLVLGVATGLSCLVFLVVFLVCISKIWG